MNEGRAHAARRRGLFGVMRWGQTYRNLLYLILACPVAWLYWILFQQGAQTAADAGPVGLLLVLLFLLGASWYVAMLERWLVGWLLRVKLTPMAGPVPEGATIWDRVTGHLRNLVTWQNVPWAVFGTPEATARFVGALGIQPSHWQIVPAYLAAALLVALLGVLALLAVLHVLNGVTWLWGRFARLMLGLSDKDFWLAEARVIAARESARADRAEHGRRELILNASHELRTPIASIRAHIESLLILQGESLPDNIRGFLTITQREAERLGALVDDLLMLARADADELRLDVRPVAVGEVVDEVYQALEPLAQREREVTLVRIVAPDLPPALADRDRLAQVLLNLVRNAITYTPDGGVVSIELAPGDAGYLTLSVTDTGIGIPPEEVERVFDRFYRTDASRTRGTGGFGLGLSIVRDLVQAMGGSVAAERVPEGGSRFRVSLRAAQVTANI
jgi:two-component system phosphate regulon sensor histidine kinase PhoR